MQTKPTAQSRRQARPFTLLLAASMLLHPLFAEQTGPPRRVLAADDSTHRLGIVGLDGTLEWETEVSSIHDASVLTNGNILFQRNWTEIVEVTPGKQLVWKYEAGIANGNRGRRVEVHSFQRLDNGLTLIAESGPGRIIEVDTEGRLQREVRLQIHHPDPHMDTRLVRKISNGNYLVSQQFDGLVCEYTAAGTIVWQYQVPLFGQEPKPGHGPEAFGNFVFSAIRLPNGNTLIGGGNGHCILEVTPSQEIVWKVEQNDLPGVTLAWVTRVERLANGNTLVGNCHAGPGNPQMLEITNDKKVVWSFKDFKNFGNATTVCAVLTAN